MRLAVVMALGLATGPALAQKAVEEIGFKRGGPLRLGPGSGSLMYAMLGMQIGRKLPKDVAKGFKTRVRLVSDESGAILLAQIVGPSKSPAFDEAVMNTVLEFAPDGPHRLRVPTQKAAREKMLGAGISVLVMVPGAQKTPRAGLRKGPKLPPKFGGFDASKVRKLKLKRKGQ